MIFTLSLFLVRRLKGRLSDEASEMLAGLRFSFVNGQYQPELAFPFRSYTIKGKQKILDASRFSTA